MSKWGKKQVNNQQQARICKLELALPEGRAHAILGDIQTLLNHVIYDELALLAKAVQKPMLKAAAIAELRKRV